MHDLWGEFVRRGEGRRILSTLFQSNNISHNEAEIQTTNESKVEEEEEMIPINPNQGCNNDPCERPVVLEIGSGVGVLSIKLAMEEHYHVSQSTIQDSHQNEPIELLSIICSERKCLLDHITSNIALNPSSSPFCSVMELEVGKVDVRGQFPSSPPTLMIASDILYDSSIFEPLSALLQDLPSTPLLILQKDRRRYSSSSDLKSLRKEGSKDDSDIEVKEEEIEIEEGGTSLNERESKGLSFFGLMRERGCREVRLIGQWGSEEDEMMFVYLLNPLSNPHLYSPLTHALSSSFQTIISSS